MVDIARDARWGRIVEGAGEDPYLGAAMARARVRGFQGSDYSAPDRIVACAKHWVGLRRGRRRAAITTRRTCPNATLREIYFPPFKAAVDAGVGTFMSAFNDLNGVPTSANPFTLTTGAARRMEVRRLRRQRLHVGQELINHGLAADEAEAARAGAQRGRRHGDGQPSLQ